MWPKPVRVSEKLKMRFCRKNLHKQDTGNILVPKSADMATKD